MFAASVHAITESRDALLAVVSVNSYARLAGSMQHTKTSWNASVDLGLMDTFLSLPKSKRWVMSKMARGWWKLADWVERAGLYLEPREVHVNERLLEIPFILQRLPQSGRLLDVGCSSSSLALQLACLGYQVTGVDLRTYPFHHPNLRFIHQDLLKAQIEFDTFDGAILISVLEHAGLGSYGDDRRTGDRGLLDAVARHVKPGGAIWLTVPFGRPFEGTWYRVYSSETLKQVTQGYNLAEAKFFRRLSLLSWQECLEQDLAEVASERLPVNGVALLELWKSRLIAQ